MQVHLVDFGLVDPRKQPLIDEIRNKYVGKLTDVGSKFDIVLIDGRFRRRCLALARQMQSDTGIIFLMDAERPYYLNNDNESQPGALLYTGISPFQKEKKKKYMWIGCKTPEVLIKFQKDVLDLVDVSALIQQSEEHHSWLYEHGLVSRLLRKMCAWL